MKFENYPLSPDIKRSLVTLGFVRPTDIQFRAIPAILKGEDVLAIAHTGTGKTAAFAIPVINQLHEQKSSKRSEGVKCLVMVPTRELAVQISKVFEQLGRYTRVKTTCLFGGVEQEPQVKSLESGTDVLVATPGRMFDLVSQGFLHLDKVETLVLDEADHMLDLGFIEDIRQLVRILPRKHQTLFFSATINEKIKKLAYSLVHNPIHIQISPKDKVSKNIDHSVAFIGLDDKRFFLERLIKNNPESKILVFVRTRVRAERVLKAMERAGIAAGSIHGDKEQHQRLDIMKRFREGAVKVLIATDVSARGIDIPDVDFVVNYDLPGIAENYVHRIGRTGRGTSRGQAISFCSEDEKELLAGIEEFLTVPVSVMSINRSDYTAILDMSKEKQEQSDWRQLLEEEEQQAGRKKKHKRSRS